MLIGYIRVSKSDGTQTLEPQRDALLAAGIDPSRIYEDMASGRHDARPGLTACLKALQPGNTLVIWKLDRLGRDLRHLVTTAEDLRSRGIGLKVLAGAGAQIDTTSANGRLAFGIFAAFAEFERELIAERTHAGLTAARARGRMGGRPRKMNRATLAMAMAAMSDRGAVAADVAKGLGITTTTLYVYVNGDGTPKAPGQALLDARPNPATPKPGRVMSAGVTVPIEAIVTLRRRLAALPVRHPERQPLMASTAELYDISRATLYRLLRGEQRPKDAHRADRGQSRTMSDDEIEWWCEVVAAMKSRTTNRQGRRLSTKRILEIVTEHGVETPDRGLVKLPPGRLAASTLNRHMRQRGYDTERMTREPAAVRYQAERSNMLWHFDMSPSDLKQLKAPTWIDPDRNGAPTLMLFSVVDDRSGIVYQEYALVYGEDAEAALRFLFRAMAPKEDNPFEGIPENIQLDGGPVGKSSVFKRVMECLGITVTPHMPAGSDGRRTTARAKGKVERPFRTVKEAHETLYHFHEPASEEEANRWLARYIATYNSGDHRREPHSRIDDWLGHLPEGGIRAMCGWERYCAFAREPERRKVGLDCRLTVAGVSYEVTSEVAGETVVVWWGLFDQELWVEHGDERYGPFDPVGGPVPLHRYRKHRKSRREVRADRVDVLATKIGIPRSVLTGENDIVVIGRKAADGIAPVPVRPFADPDPFAELTFATPLKARFAISEELRLPLGGLCEDDRAFIDALLARTLSRPEVMDEIRRRFPPGHRRSG